MVLPVKGVQTKPFDDPEGLDELPAGFSVPAAPSAPTAGFDELPAGFSVSPNIQQPAAQAPAGGLDELPEGFAVQPQEDAGYGSALIEGLLGGGRSVVATGQAVAGAEINERHDTPLAEPFNMEDAASPFSKGGPKALYKMAESWPMLAAGVGGTVLGGQIGSAAGPVGTASGAMLGGTIGAGVGAGIQTLGDTFRQQLAANPGDPHKAWDIAVKETALAGGFAAASWRMFGADFIGNELKHLAFKTIVGQSALGAGEVGSRNYVADRDISEGMAGAVIDNIVLGVPTGYVQHKLSQRAERQGFDSPPGVKQEVSPEDVLGMAYKDNPLPEGMDPEGPEAMSFIQDIRDKFTAQNRMRKFPGELEPDQAEAEISNARADFKAQTEVTPANIGRKPDLQIDKGYGGKLIDAMPMEGQDIQTKFPDPNSGRLNTFEPMRLEWDQANENFRPTAKKGLEVIDGGKPAEQGLKFKDGVMPEPMHLGMRVKPKIKTPIRVPEQAQTGVPFILKKGYHGTSQAVQNPPAGKLTPQTFLKQVPVLFFTDDTVIANGYTGAMPGWGGPPDGSAIYQYELEFQNPYVLDTKRNLFEVAEDYYRATIDQRYGEAHAKHLSKNPMLSEYNNADAWMKFTEEAAYQGFDTADEVKGAGNVFDMKQREEKANLNSYYGDERMWDKMKAFQRMDPAAHSELFQAAQSPGVGNMIEDIARAGHDGIILRGVKDIISPADSYGSSQNQYVVIEPHVIKTKQSAVFDVPEGHDFAVEPGRGPLERMSDKVRTFKTREKGDDVDLGHTDMPALMDPLDTKMLDMGLDEIVRRVKAEAAQENMIQNYSDNIPRYVLEGDDSVGGQFLTSTDVELMLSIRGNTPEQARIRQVDMKSLDERFISADVHDLPSFDDRRVMPNSRFDLRDNYEHIRALVDAGQADEARRLYKDLIASGDLRVVPSPGNTFLYAKAGIALGPVVRQPKTGRQKQMLILNTSQYTKSTTVTLMHPQERMEGRMMGMTIDINKAKIEDHFINFSMVDFDKMVFPESVKTELAKQHMYQQYLDAVQANDSLRVKNFWKDGIYAKPTVDMFGHLAGDAILVTEIPKKALVASYKGATTAEQMPPHQWNWKDPQFQGTVQNLVRGSGLEAHKINVAADMEYIAKKIQPALAKIAHKMGAKWNPDFVITTLEKGADRRNSSPYALTERNMIVFPVEWFSGRGHKVFRGDMEIQMVQIGLHELGHLITYRSWHKLPYAMQTRLKEAYNRALLNYSLERDLAKFQGIYNLDNNLHTSSTYHLKFTEWMAEQFRRWASYQPEIRNDFEKNFSEVGRQWDELVDYYVQRDGVSGMEQRFTPVREFHQWMDYNENMANTPNQPLHMSIRQAAELDRNYRDPFRQQFRKEGVPYRDPYEVIRQTADEVRVQVAQMKEMFRKDTALIIDEKAISQIDKERAGGLNFAHYNYEGNVLRVMAGALAWLKNQDHLPVHIQRLLRHEIFHSVAHVLTKGQKELLVKVSKDLGIMEKVEAGLEKWYEGQARKAYEAMGLRGEQLEYEVKRYVDEEHMAFLVEGMTDGHINADAKSTTIAMKFKEFIERIGNFLNGKGYNTAKDLMHAFNRGELARRAERRNTMQRPRDREGVPRKKFSPDTTVDAGDGVYASFSEREYVFGYDYFHFYNKSGEEIGFIKFSTKEGQPYIDYIKSTMSFGEAKQWVKSGKSLPAKMIAFAEGHYGKTIKSAGEYTNAGYQMVRKGDPDSVKYYQRNSEENMWYSPKKIAEYYQDAKEELAYIDSGEVVDRDVTSERAFAEYNLNGWKKLFDAIPNEAWDDPALLKQWSMREMELAQWEKAAKQTSEEFVEDVTGESATMDPFDAAMNDKEKSEAETNANITGYKYGAPTQPEAMSFRRIVDGGQYDPEIAKHLNRQAHLYDKIGWIAKNFMTLRQVSYRNPKVVWLRNIISFSEQQQQRVMEWVNRADETARQMDALPHAEKEGLTKLLYWAEGQKYLGANEPSRHPTLAEISREAKRLKLGSKSIEVFVKIKGDFDAVLAKMEVEAAKKIQRKISDPTAQGAALAKLASDMAEMRSKPYFPMTRFGNHTVTFKNAEGKVVWHSSHDTRIEADLAAKRMAKNYPGAELQLGLVPESVQDFVNLPTPILERIKTDMDGITPEQVEWIEKFQIENSPDWKFKNDWMQQRDVPGYSMNGIRVYANYFRSMSRYLARMEFNDAIQGEIRAGQAEIKALPDGRKRQKIMDMVNSHFEWENTAGKDWTNIRAFATVFYLGVAPVVAFMNLGQLFQHTVPYLRNLHGNGAYLESVKHILPSIQRTRGLIDPKADPMYAHGHAEAVQQGKIDTGQAAELGMFTGQTAMDRLYGGTRLQRAARQASTTAMWMFSKAERYNREYTFAMAFRMSMEALKKGGNKHTNDIFWRKHQQIMDLKARKPEMTSDAAIATFAAIEAVDRTQFTYDSWDRPRAFRNPVVNSMAVFTSFIQQSLFAVINNPGRANTLITSLILFGASGLPGAQDIDEMVRAFARHLYGKDWSPRKALREQAVALSQGTRYSEVAPDLLDHGISRFSFGLGILPDSFGMPKFDASANGSMGRVVPGLAEAARGIGNLGGPDSNAMNEVIGAFAQDVAGAGYGPLFSMIQLMGSPPGSSQWTKWEKMFPRGVKAFSRGARFAYQGNSGPGTGAEVKWDLNDPTDRWTLAMQMAGFTPTKMGQHYDAMAERTAQQKFYEAKKYALIMAMKVAVGNNDEKGVESVSKEIESWNKEVAAQGVLTPTTGIKPANLVKSLKTRTKNEALQGMGLPTQKGLIPLDEKVDRLYPRQVRPQEIPADGQVIDQRTVR